MAATSREQQERKIDQALEQTFPASDTPSFVGGGARPDRPPHEESKKGKKDKEELSGAAARLAL